MLRVGIVGLGRWGKKLVCSIQDQTGPKSGHLRFVRGVTRTPETAEEFARQTNLALGDNFPDLLRDPEIDAVVLATPHTQHASQIVAAALAGKHVFVEKPLALTRRNAEEAVAASNRANVVLAAGHNRRFLPAMRELKQLVATGQLGAILHIEGNLSAPVALSYVPGTWRASSAESPVGGMTGMGIHVIDTMIHLVGGIRSVQAQSFRVASPIEGDDTTSVLLRFRQGCTGYLGTMTTTALNWRIQAFGTKGWAETRNNTVLETSFTDDRAGVTNVYPSVDIEKAELEAFANAICGIVSYPISTVDVIEGVAALEAIVTSAREQRPVDVL